MPLPTSPKGRRKGKASPDPSKGGEKGGKKKKSFFIFIVINWPIRLPSFGGAGGEASVLGKLA